MMYCTLFVCLFMGLATIKEVYSEVHLKKIVKKTETLTFYDIILPDDQEFSRVDAPYTQDHVFVPNPQKRPAIVRFNEGDLSQIVGKMHIKPVMDPNCDMIVTYYSFNPEEHPDFDRAEQKNEHVGTSLRVRAKPFDLSPSVPQSPPKRQVPPGAPTPGMVIPSPPTPAKVIPQDPGQRKALLPSTQAPKVLKPFEVPHPQQASKAAELPKPKPIPASKPKDQESDEPSELIPLEVYFNGERVSSAEKLDLASKTDFFDKLLSSVMQLPSSQVPVPKGPANVLEKKPIQFGKRTQFPAVKSNQNDKPSETSKPDTPSRERPNGVAPPAPKISPVVNTPKTATPNTIQQTSEVTPQKANGPKGLYDGPKDTEMVGGFKPTSGTMKIVELTDDPVQMDFSQFLEFLQHARPKSN